VANIFPRFIFTTEPDRWPGKWLDDKFHKQILRLLTAQARQSQRQTDRRTDGRTDGKAFSMAQRTTVRNVGHHVLFM